MEIAYQPIQDGFKLNNLILMESNFKREAEVVFENDKIENLANVDVQVQVIENMAIVTETLDYTQKFEGKICVTVKIVMVGIFEKIGNPKADFETFGYVNGAAIIFPYIREQLTNLSVKAGLGVILLPPANFTQNKVPTKK